MKFAIAHVATAGLALATGALPASASDIKTWYVYCDGNNRQGDYWAVFSENFWSHPLTEGYGHDVAAVAEAIFESQHNVQLDGCAGINFVDPRLAELSRRHTARLHEKMGDRVLYFRLPDEALPAERNAEAPVAVGLREVIEAAPKPADKAAEQQPTFAPRVPDR